MALEDVKTYVNARMLSLGFEEWQDNSTDNIPNVRRDMSWHLEYGIGNAVKSTQQPIDVKWPFSLRIFRSAAREPTDLQVDIVKDMDRVIKDLLKASNRLTTANALKNLFLESFRIEKLGNTNDNGVTGIIEFTALVVIDVD